MHEPGVDFLDGYRSTDLSPPRAAPSPITERQVNAAQQAWRDGLVSVAQAHARGEVADCFKFRNKIGKHIAIEALRTYLRRKDAKVKDLMHFARINRVQAVMAPYVDVLLTAKG
ncbi:MAG: hypothetical protein FGM39_12145 [Phycisphaerales bacterium]|nr:hypothetical protein [Phycisphaerales bacterium]